jgi:hypothetical protein
LGDRPWAGRAHGRKPTVEERLQEPKVREVGPRYTLRTHNVSVRFARESGNYKPRVEDGGRGFGFRGWLRSRKLEVWSDRPLVVMKRVRTIGGEIMVELRKGWDARVGVGILVPLATHGRVSSDD